MPLPGQTVGDQEVITADPAAGADVSYTADDDMIVYSFVVPFVTSAVVANRRVRVVADDGADVFFRSPAVTTQAASLTRVYSGVTGSAPSADLDPDIVVGFPPEGLRLRKGDRFIVTAQNKDAGDNFGACVLHAERL